MSLTLLFILTFATILGVSADSNNGAQHTFTLTNKQIAPDGFRRRASLVNGVFPGPVLTAKKGDTVSVKVVNHLDDKSMRESTSIHWHGLFQNRNAQTDGTSFVTQCPIAPGNEYTYNLELGDQTGTYWYHSHLGTQYVDGIRGAFIIYDPDDPFRDMYDIDDANTIITLTDWFHGTAESLLATFRNGSPEPVPDSGLINGVGMYQGGPSAKLARINVVYGKRYRFRIVGMLVTGAFDFSISDHSMKVIEADGILHEPYCVDSINIFPGQRYSVVVTADKKVANYWIRATQTVIGQTSFASNPNFNGNNTHAVLHYHGAPDADPKGKKPNTLPPGGIPFEEHNMIPVENPGSPGGEFPTDLFVYNFTFDAGSANGDVWVVNNVPYKSPSVPTLLNVLANGFTNASQFGPNENTIVLPRNVTVEVVFSSPGPFGDGHPFHLHGHAFDVVQSTTGPPNYINPPRRDVVASGSNPVRIRFRTDNAGPWMVHCHIDWHLASGLSAVFVEDPQGIQNEIKPNPEWERLCSIYNKLDPAQQ